MTTPAWPLNADFRDMLAELHAAGADHLVIGAFAVSAYGHVRTTKDLDIFVRASPRRIDLTTVIDGVTFDEALVDHTLVAVGDLVVPVIGRAALLRNKRACARPQDLADVEALEALG